MLDVSESMSCFEGSDIPDKLRRFQRKAFCDGKTVDISTLSNNGKPIVISFWATWCKPCKTELNTIAEDYEDWQEETGVKLIAVSMINFKSFSGIAPCKNVFAIM